MAEMGVEKREIEKSRFVQYKGIDIFKFVMAILIVMIHAQPFTSVNETINQLVVDCIARMAVPFFFVTSGFFVFKKAEEKPGYIKRYCFRMLKLYLIWSMIYLPFNLYECVIVQEMNLKKTIYDILWRSVISGSYMQLWYFPALIVAVLLVQLCVKCKMKDTLMLLVGAGLYIVGLSYQAWHGFFMQLSFMQNENVAEAVNGLFGLIITTRNGVFFGFLFVLLGRMAARGKFLFPLKTSICGFLICLLWGVVETQYLLTNKIAWDKDMWLFLPFLSVFLFSMALQIKSKMLDKRCYVLRKASVIIFLVHVAYEVIYRAVVIKFVGGVYHSIAAFGFVITMSLLSVLIICVLEQTKYFAWIRKLFE